MSQVDRALCRVKSFESHVFERAKSGVDRARRLAVAWGDALLSIADIARFLRLGRALPARAKLFRLCHGCDPGTGGVARVLVGLGAIWPVQTRWDMGN